MQKKIQVWFFLLMALVLLSAGNLCADTVYLKNGRKIDGIVKSETAESVELEVCSGSVKFKRSEIEKIESRGSREQNLMRSAWEKQKQASQKKLEQQKQEEEKQPKKVAFSKDSLNIAIQARLNNKVDAQLVMDTGSTLVVIKKEIAEELKIKSDGANPEIKLILADGRETHARLITLESVQVEGVEAKNVEAAVMLDEITDPGFKDGLLGMSFLKRFNFKVDNREKKLILEKL